jgi:hypothetical protein
MVKSDQGEESKNVGMNEYVGLWADSGNWERMTVGSAEEFLSLAGAGADVSKHPLAETWLVIVEARSGRLMWAVSEEASARYWSARNEWQGAGPSLAATLLGARREPADDLAELFAAPQLSTDDDGITTDPQGRVWRLVEVDGEATYEPEPDATDREMFAVDAEGVRPMLVDQSDLGLFLAALVRRTGGDAVALTARWMLPADRELPMFAGSLLDSTGGEGA